MGAVDMKYFIFCRRFTFLGPHLGCVFGGRNGKRNQGAVEIRHISSAILN